MSKPMIVLGRKIPQSVVNACVARMSKTFYAANIEQVAWELGISVTDGVSMRLADRLIQREKKAGRIRRVGGKWEPVRG